MKLIDFENIDIIKHNNPHIIFVAVLQPVHRMGWQDYVSAMEETAKQAVDKVVDNIPTCFMVEFAYSMGNKDFTHFSNIMIDTVLQALLTGENRGREYRLSAGVAGNASQRVLKMLVNEVSKVDAVNVVCLCGKKKRRMV